MPEVRTREFIAAFAAVIGVILALFVLDTGLAELDARETQSEAAREFIAGRHELAQGNIARSIEHLRKASVLDRGNADYSIALAEAVRRNGGLEEAELLLAPVLDKQANSGPANLALARVSVAQRKYADAAANYHRAIFGLWPEAESSTRELARFELIDLLVKTGQQEALLAELLPIQVDSSAPDSLRIRIARLFVAAGAPARGVAIFRELIQENPRNAPAYSGMGEAALVLGNFNTARRDFIEARNIAGNDSAFAQRLAVVDSALALDPTQRGLGDREENRRAAKLLTMVAAVVQSCVQSTQNPAAVAMIDSVAHPAVPGNKRDINSVTTDYLSKVENLWKMQTPECAARQARQNEALALVVERVAR